MAVSGKTMQQVCDKAYPIGCYYFSNNPTNPGDLFGGTWLQVTDCFIKAARSSISTQGGNKTKTISNFCPPHTHNTGNHTHTISAHSHGMASTSHTHLLQGHSHSGGGSSHIHSGVHGYRSPDGEDVWTSDYGKYPVFGGAESYVWLDFISTNQVTNQSNISSSSGSTTTSSSSLGSPSNSSSSLSSVQLSTDSYGSNNSCTIDIMPPYQECYCWRRTG